jgi:predicted enzyme related to lactoylglutathione lyase
MTDSSTQGIKTVLHPFSDLAAGATVHEPAHDVGGGRLVATVSDPDGNVLGLLQDR